MSSSSLLEEPMETDSDDLQECGILWSSKKGDWAKVRELLLQGVSCNVKDADRYTPLHYAVIDGNAELVEMLIRSGAHTAIGTKPLLSFNLDSHPDIVRLLCAAPDFDPNHKDPCKQAALHHYAMAGRHDLIKLLLQHRDTNANLQDGNSWTPLLWACYENHLEAVDVLLQAGARMDLTETEKWTPLHWAAFKALPRIVERLLSGGAAHWAEDNEGFTALYLASLGCHKKPTTEKLGENSSNDDSNCVAVAKLLIEAGADVNKAGSIGWTPLHRAVYEENVPFTEVLLQAGAQPELQNISGDTALHIATSNQNLLLIQLLIRAGTTGTPTTMPLLHIQDIEWKTPLHRAIQTLNPDVLRPFLGAGAGFNGAKQMDIENTVMETVAKRLSPIANCKLYLGADELLHLLYEAGMVRGVLARRMLAFIGKALHVPSLSSLTRLCIHRYICGVQTEAAYAQLGLPPLLQRYLAYNVMQ